jgi:hypothetical protein
MFDPNDEEKELEELNDELESSLDDDRVVYWDDGKKKTLSQYSWGENGC